MLVAEIIGPELLLVLAVVALLFGAPRLPKLARSLGSAKSEFEQGLREASDAPRSGTDTRVTMTRGELDALLGEAERRAAEGDGPGHR